MGMRGKLGMGSIDSNEMNPSEDDMEDITAKEDADEIK